MKRNNRSLTGGRHRAIVAVLAAMSLLLGACGSRLTDDERAQAISLLRGGGSSQSESDGGLAVGGAGGLGEGSSDDGGTSDGGTDGGTTTTTTGGSSGSDEGGGGGGSEPQAPADIGPLTASDVGVTPQEIAIANIADITGVQPGLFQSARDASTAATAFINGRGGINGRRIRLLPLDGKTDSGANRTAMLEACDRAFAVVGSVSAFDDGSAQPGEACGIPDLTAVSTNGPKFRASNTHPIYPNGPELISVTPAKVIAERFPEAIKNAGILWLNQTVTSANAQRRMEAWESVGFEFIYQQEVQVLEPDYTRFVLDMEDRGVEYVTMVSDYQSIVRLQEAMFQQSYEPTVRDWDSVTYDENYLTLGGDAVEGSVTYVNNAMFSDESNAEMQLYREWLQRAVPGAKPTYFGLYAWSGFRLFQQIATEMGADLTREGFLERIRGVTEWNGHGIHAPHNVGEKIPGTCNLHMRVEGGQFRRFHPSSGFDCSGSIYRLSQSYE